MQRHEVAYMLPQENPLNGLAEDEQSFSEGLRRVFFGRLVCVGFRARHSIDDCSQVLSQWNRWSPVCDWVESIPWDGVSRFEDLVCSVEVADPELWRLYLRRWLVQGMQAWNNWRGRPQAIENVLVLVGKQNAQKTRWLNSLVRDRDFTRGVMLNLGSSLGSDRDSIRRATAAPLAELGEIETTFSRSAHGNLKNFLSQTEDVYRLAYGRTEVRYPRTTSFAGTVNTRDFLVDPTGSRRFWPVQVYACDAQHGINVQQLWAEVRTWWAAGEQWWLSEEEDARRSADSDRFSFENAAAERVREHLESRSSLTTQGMTCVQVMTMLDIVPNNANKRSVAAVLTDILGPRRWIDGVRNAWPVPTAYGAGSGLSVVDKQG